MSLESVGIQIIGGIQVEDCAMAMDGGSKVLFLRDSQGNKFELLLPQHQIKGNFGEFIPGRIHLNGHSVKIRSNDEMQLMEKLSKFLENNPLEKKEKVTPPQNRLIIGDDISDYYSEMDKGPKHATHHLVKEVINFVNSESYIEVAEAMKKEYKSD